MASRGHDVHVFCGKPGPSRTEQSDGMTVHYYSLRYHPITMAYLPWLYVYGFGLDSIPGLMKGRFDLLHIFTYSYAFAAPILQRLRHTPYVFHVVVDDPGLKAGLSRWAYEQLLKGADQVATLTQRGAEYISRRFGVEPVVLPPPVDLDTFRPLESRDPHRPAVLFTGDLGDPRKGAYLLLRAWGTVHRAYPDARLVLAGTFGLAWNNAISGLWDAIPRLVPDADARSNIEIPGTGTLADLPRLYAEACVTVLPSVQEAFGMAITESLASGTPVVCSDDAGPAEILAGNRAIGRTVSMSEMHHLWSAASVAPLATAVVEALELSRNPETAAACRAHVEPFSIPSVGARAEALYQQVLAHA